MKAIIELFDYMLYWSHLPLGSELRIFLDSQYVIRSLLGDQLPSTHHQLAELAQQYFTALRTIHFVQLVKVSSHIGVPGNELADVFSQQRSLIIWISGSILNYTDQISFSTRNRIQL